LSVGAGFDVLSGPKEGMMSDTRITKLEVELSHLARTVDELNEVVTKQADEIELLTRRVRIGAAGRGRCGLWQRRSAGGSAPSPLVI